jgi:endonuclease/exonuclease/phosphatase family metal-dependent hydrolase
MSIKVVTLNIEGDKHIDRFLPVLQDLQPDVVCLQELFEEDVPGIVAALNMSSHIYVPTMKVEQENRYRINPRGNWGIGMLTRLEVKSAESFYYRDFTDLKVFEEPNDAVPAVIVTTVSDGKTEYRIATTHFTWSPGGETTDLQRQDFEQLTSIVSQYPDLVLCGDFNAPRGREIFSLFEERYTDNLPKDVTTTIDNSLHYAGQKNLQLVVDSIFSTPEYIVSNVQILSEVSDHMGVYGEIEKLD